MILAECETDLLRRLAETPFLDRLDLAALTGWSRGAVYSATAELKERGMVDAIPHATPFLPSTRRFYITWHGINRLAEETRVTTDSLLKLHPFSHRWQRLLLERLDGLSVIFRLAAAVSNSDFPIGITLFRAAPADAGFTLPDGRTLAVVRQGHTADRTGFSKRLWRLGEGPLPGGLLVLVPDEVRLRQARRMLAQSHFPVFLALEREAASAGPESPVWRPPSVNANLDLRYVLSHLDERGRLPLEAPPARAGPPREIELNVPPGSAPGWLLPPLLGPSEKRTLDLLSDWPWASTRELAGMIGVSTRRVSQMVAGLEQFGLAAYVNEGRTRRLALSDRGLALLARRDRTSLGGARWRWSASPLDQGAVVAWRNVTGSRTRQLLRNIEHTAAVHRFLATLGEQARRTGWQVAQLDPPRRASRYFHHHGRLHSVLPDAFAVLRRGNENMHLFLEWERRAVRPATMTARLAPYLRYFSTRRPLDDHGALPVVMVVFDDELAATHFMRVASAEMQRAGVDLPLRVSHRAALERSGPLGRVWLSPYEWDFCHTIQG